MSGMTRIDRPDGTRPPVASLDGGVGVAREFGKRILGYALAEGAFIASGSLDRNHAMGAGSSAGVIVDATPRWRLHAQGRGLRFFEGERRTSIEAKLDQRVTLARDLAVRLETSWRRDHDAIRRTAVIYVDRYF